jgi:HSP20 family protein
MAQRSMVPSGGRANLARPEFGLFGMLHNQIDRLFDDLALGAGPSAAPLARPSMAPIGDMLPRIEVRESDREIEITAELAGLDRGDVEISVDGDTLVIRGEKRAEQEEDNENVRLTERVYGVFYRTIQLPPGVDPSSIQATMSNGVLRITVPKPAQNGARKIEVQDERQGGSQQAGAQAEGKPGGRAESKAESRAAGQAEGKAGGSGEGKTAA